MICFVVTPDGLVYDVELESKSKGQQLLEKISEMLGIKAEMDYFGFKSSDIDENIPWINLRNTIENHNNSWARFYLRVKFWTTPHLILLDSTRHLLYVQIISDIKKKRLNPPKEDEKNLCNLIRIAESHGIDYSDEKDRFWLDFFGQNHDLELPKTENKRAIDEYWVLKEVSKYDKYGEETYDVKGTKIGIGPHGIRIYEPEQEIIAYSSIRSTSTFRRHFELKYTNINGEEGILDVKCRSVPSASELYRSLTERHDFYSCETVRTSVSSQYVRDLKGTIASIFNESTLCGKKYVFDIQKTCREVHDSARRALYTPKTVQNEEKTNGPGFRLNSILDAFTCSVCMDGQIDTLFTPCAHVVTCSSCAPRLDLCPLCRTQIEKYQKLYLPAINIHDKC